jgi:hypothetical protein
MSHYYGIIIENSLRASESLDRGGCIASRVLGGWKFLLFRVGESELTTQIIAIQEQMLDIAQDCWYAHFFRDNELIVVFQDSVFRVSISEDSWKAPIEHGIRRGVPLEQLDFKPRTSREALLFFGLPA